MQAGADIAPEAHHLEVGPEVEQEGPAAVRPGGHHGPGGQVGQTSADEAVAHRAPGGKGPDGEALGSDGLEILGRVDGEVGPPGEHQSLHLLGERPLAPDVGDRAGEVEVGGGIDRHQLDLDRARARRLSRDGRGQEVADMIGLPDGEGAAPGGDPDLHDRSNSSLTASASRSPRAVPAASLRVTVGWCRSLATSVFDRASTASRSSSLMAARREA